MKNKLAKFLAVTMILSSFTNTLASANYNLIINNDPASTAMSISKKLIMYIKFLVRLFLATLFLIL